MPIVQKNPLGGGKAGKFFTHLVRKYFHMYPGNCIICRDFKDLQKILVSKRILQ